MALASFILSSYILKFIIAPVTSSIYTTTICRYEHLVKQPDKKAWLSHHSDVFLFLPK